MAQDDNATTEPQLNSDVLEYDSKDIVRPGSSRPSTEAHAAESNAGTEEGAHSPFPDLDSPRLPQLDRENRANLLVQTPNRLYFYWSLKNDPSHSAHRALRQPADGYSLVLKLMDLTRGTEQLYPIGEQGSWWFDVETNTRYRAEIGLFATSRPFVRILFSNDVVTPRSSPSKRTATSKDWAVAADKFARVLKGAGFARDAFEVAVAGDDSETAETAARAAFARLVPNSGQLTEIDADELRLAMLALASGAAPDSFRGHIGPALYKIITANAGTINTNTAARILNEEFDVDVEEWTFDETGPSIFGASEMNIPRKLRKRIGFPKFTTVSSHDHIPEKPGN